MKFKKTKRVWLRKKFGLLKKITRNRNNLTSSFRRVSWKEDVKLLIFYHHQIFWTNKFSTRIFNHNSSPTPSITISFSALYTFYSDFCSCFLFFSVAPLKIVVSEAVFGMDDGRSSDAGRPRLPGVCIVDVDSNAEPYWLLLVFLPKRARVCSNQLTACPINTGALISLSLSLSVVGVFRHRRRRRLRLL